MLGIDAPALQFSIDGGWSDLKKNRRLTHITITKAKSLLDRLALNHGKRYNLISQLIKRPYSLPRRRVARGIEALRRHRWLYRPMAERFHHVSLDDRGLVHDHGMPDHILQLTDIARSVMAFQGGLRAVSQGFERLAFLLRKLLEECFRDLEDIITTLSKRR